MGQAHAMQFWGVSERDTLCRNLSKTQKRKNRKNDQIQIFP